MFRQAHAAIITVNSTADAGGTCPGADCTLRQAIASAAPTGTTINFALPANSTINLTSGELRFDRNLTIVGPGADLLTVQRSTAPGIPNFRIFHTGGYIGSDRIVNISGLTIANGVAAATLGDSSGGGIYAYIDTNLTLTNVTISGNQGQGGGGISNTHFNTVTITNCTLSDNSAGTGLGGGIYNNATMSISGSTISDNSAGTGGGIYNYARALPIINSTLARNSATGDGGGMSNLDGTPTLTNVTFSENSAGTGSKGGAIHNQTGTLTLRNCTLTKNSAGTGGGIRWEAGTVNFKNTIVSLNNAPVGPNASGDLNSQGYNIIGAGGVTVLGDNTGNQFDVDPKLGDLADNGGATFTHALLPSSPAIDKGHSSGATTDQRGLTRPVDDPGIPPATGSDGADISAYEVQPDQLPGCSSINRIVQNNNDGGPNSLRFVTGNVCAGSTVTFAPNVTGAINLTSGEVLLTKNVTINGPGANLLTVQRSAAAVNNFRIFNIASASINATISGLTIANGNILAPQLGGGIQNLGALTLTNATVSGNSAVGTGFSFTYGGGISNGGFLTLINSTISGNTSNYGGGIYSSGMVTISNSTISGNTVSSNVDSGAGGGILSQSGTLTLTNSTVSGNTAQGPAGNSGGGILNSSGTVYSRSTIIALNTAPSGPDFAGLLDSYGFNLVGNASNMTLPAWIRLDFDQFGTAQAPIDPKLDPAGLQYNGGPTKTIALLFASPAIDKGTSDGLTGKLTTDQRGTGFPRIADFSSVANASDYPPDGTDIGALEFWSLKIVSITRLTNGHTLLQCLGVPNQLNKLQVSPDLSSGSFAPSSPAPVAAEGPAPSHTTTPVQSAKRNDFIGSLIPRPHEIAIVDFVKPRSSVNRRVLISFVTNWLGTTGVTPSIPHSRKNN